MKCEKKNARKIQIKKSKLGKILYATFCKWCVKIKRKNNYEMQYIKVPEGNS